MSSSITLSKTQNHDLDFVINAERHPDNCDYVYQWSHAEHLQALSNPDQAHYIIKLVETGEMVGYVILDEVQNSSHSINLRRLVVIKKGLGIGAKALKAIQQIAFIQLNAHRLWLDVFTDNQTAYQLYKKVGFVEEGKLRESYLRNGTYASQYIMAILKSEYI
jgi:RimJ/RimL family protein N-acetyltransferase